MGKRCDLLENTYLCGSNNNHNHRQNLLQNVVICLKIRTFVLAITTGTKCFLFVQGCDLLENTYLCGSNNNVAARSLHEYVVVICLKIRTFVVAITTLTVVSLCHVTL